MVDGDQRFELTREELYELVWVEPIMKLARRYGLSDRGLAKICDRMGIPVPGRGYWAKVQSGQSLPQPKLPKIKAGQQSRVVLSKDAKNHEEGQEYDAVSALVASEALPENQITVPEELTDPHPLVQKTAKSLRGAGANDYGLVKPRARHCLDVRIGKQSIERASRILDALVTALEERDIALVFDEEEDQTARMLVDGETIVISLEEKVRRERYQPTPAEQKRLEDDFWYRLPKDKFFPKQRVESCLNKFIAAAHKAAAAKKADRIERERQKREWAEQERRREILRAQIEREQERLDVLNEQARAWQEAQQLRAYIQAVRNADFYAQRSITGGQDIDEWCAWALEQASRLDPTMTSPPTVLDHKRKFCCYR
jgi:hypothetical protein